jgi:integrase
MSTKKVTKRTVDETVARATATGQDQFIWDTELTGFGFKATPKGRASYLVQKNGKRLKIGAHGVWTPEQARVEAARLLRVIDTGGDPAAAKRAQKEAPTVTAFAERFMSEHVETKLKPGTRPQYRWALDRMILPVIGAKKLIDVTHADIARLHHKLRATPYNANFAVAVASSMFRRAKKWGEVGSNPCQGIEHYPETARERMLTSDELGRLADALAAATCSPFAVAAIRLLVFTGARRDEIRTLKWSEIDFENGQARLPDSKTGSKTLFLPPPALQVLAKLPRVEDNPHIIVGHVRGKPLSPAGVEKPWFAIRKAAGLEEVRLHDLRHCFASVAASSGQSLAIIGKMLSNPTSVGRYVHLTRAWNDPVKAAAEATAAKIAAAMQPRAPADDATVVPMRSSR